MDDDSPKTQADAPAPPTAANPAEGELQPNAVYVRAAGNGMAVAALVCGIVGALFGIIPILFFISLPLGILAVIFGFVGRRKARKDPMAGRKTMATWGVACGVLAILLGMAGVVIVNSATDDLNRNLDRIDREFRETNEKLDDEFQEKEEELDAEFEGLK